MEAYTCGERQTEGREDYQLYDRIWQRVSPELNPYPGVRAEQGVQGTGSPALRMETPVSPAPLAPEAGGQSPTVVPAAASEGAGLPGALPDPCCMGTAAQQSLGVLQGFLDEECRQRMFYLSQARRQSRGDRADLLRRMAERSLSHIRQLAAAGYLITGGRVRPALQSVVPQALPWPQLLRECYHDEICDRFNYMRAADETLDPCVAGLFRSLGEDSGDQAEELFQELARLMCRGR